MRLGGWQRIGIVLSVVWALGAAVYQREADVQRADAAGSAAYDLCVASGRQLENEIDPEGPEGFKVKGCLREELERRFIALDESWVRVAVLALVPIPLGGGIAYLLVVVSRWVIAGFQRKPPSN